MIRPIRFSLRSVLVIVAISAIWFAYQARRESQRRELVHAIELAGGSVSTSDSSVFTLFRTKSVSSVAIPYWSLDDFSDDELGIFDGLTEIVVLEFQCSFPPEESSSSAKPSMMAGMSGMTSERLSVSPNAVELLRKIRDRQAPISLEETIAAHPRMR